MHKYIIWENEDNMAIVAERWGGGDCVSYFLFWDGVLLSLGTKDEALREVSQLLGVYPSWLENEFLYPIS